MIGLDTEGDGEKKGRGCDMIIFSLNGERDREDSQTDKETEIQSGTVK